MYEEQSLDFKETLELLQSCRSVEDALKIFHQITASKMDIVIPATQEKVDQIVREFEGRLRQGDYPSDLDLSPENKEALERFLESFGLPQQGDQENKDGSEVKRNTRQLSRQKSEEMEMEMKIIASHFSKTLGNSPEQGSREEINAVKIIGAEAASETDFRFASLVEPFDSSAVASAYVPQVASKKREDVATPTEISESVEEIVDLEKSHRSKIQIFSSEQEIEHYLKSHIDPDAFNWRIIDRVAEFVVLSLHALFGSDRVREIENEGGDVENMKHLDACLQFYQPFLDTCKCGVHHVYKGKKLGETKRAIYKQGEQGDYSTAVTAMEKSGMEVALVKMDSEEEISTDLPEMVFEQWNNLGWGTEIVFKGKLKSYHDIPLDSDVYKIGRKTGLTKGVITKKNEPYKLLNGVMLLFNQMEVKWENVPFSEPGDSGSMVFTVVKGEITAIGIVTGCRKEKKFSIVTPISEILDYIGEKDSAKYYRLKQFMFKKDARIVRKIITDKIIKRALPRS